MIATFFIRFETSLQSKQRSAPHQDTLRCGVDVKKGYDGTEHPREETNTLHCVLPRKIPL